jgi:hypothetical protein
MPQPGEDQPEYRLRMLRVTGIGNDCGILTIETLPLRDR